MLVLLLLAFGSLLQHLHRMFSASRAPEIARGERMSAPLVLLVVPLVALVWLGVALPAAVSSLFTLAAEVLRP